DPVGCCGEEHLRSMRSLLCRPVPFALVGFPQDERGIREGASAGSAQEVIATVADPGVGVAVILGVAGALLLLGEQRISAPEIGIGHGGGASARREDLADTGDPAPVQSVQEADPFHPPPLIRRLTEIAGITAVFPRMVP